MSLLNKSYKKVLIDFIHIPKTGGTSIKSLIKNHRALNKHITCHNHERNFFSLHDSRRKVQDINKIAFFVIRDPMGWYKSVYNFKMNATKKSDIKSYPNMPKNTWRDFFADCVLLENGEEGLYRWFRPWEIYHNGYCEYLKPGEGLYSAVLRYYSSCDLTKLPSDFPSISHSHSLYVLRQDHLENDFNSFINMFIHTKNKFRLEKKNTSTQVDKYVDHLKESDLQIINERDYKLYENIINLYSRHFI